MKFYFNENEEQNILKVYQDILVVFDKEGCYAQNGGGDFSVYLKDSFLSIDVDVESRRVVVLAVTLIFLKVQKFATESK